MDASIRKLRISEDTPLHKNIDVSSDFTHSDLYKYASLFNILRSFEEYTLNASGTIVSSNLEAVNITGYEEWEVIGKSFSIFYSPSEQAEGKPNKDLQRAKEEGRIVIKGWRVKKRNVAFWAKVKIEYLKTSNHGPAVFRMVLHDTTHKAMYRYQVKKIKKEYLNLFNNSYTGIFRFRYSSGKVILLNDKAFEIIGQDSVEPTSFRDLFFHGDEFVKFCSELRINERVLDFEFKTKGSKTSEQWLSVTCKFFFDDDFVEGIMTDITEKKKQVMELERLNHDLDQFIYHASHDLRSPLTTVLGLVNLIKMEKPNSQIQEYSSMMEERILHLDRLLKDLVSLVHNNKTGLTAEYFSLDQEVKLCMAELNNQYPAVKIELNTREDAAFFTDPVRVRSIFRNILSNALKYHHAEAPSPEVIIDIHCNNENAIIQFSDNGIGIEEQYQDKIFEMFFRATTKYNGTGLGLYIVKCLVEKLNGKISFVSAKGKGTIFIVELPNQSTHLKLKTVL